MGVEEVFVGCGEGIGGVEGAEGEFGVGAAVVGGGGGSAVLGGRGLLEVHIHVHVELRERGVCGRRVQLWRFGQCSLSIAFSSFLLLFLIHVLFTLES